MNIVRAAGAMNSILTALENDRDVEYELYLDEGTIATTPVFAFLEIQEKDGVITSDWKTLADPSVVYVPIGTMRITKGQLNRTSLGRYVTQGWMSGIYNPGQIVEAFAISFWYPGIAGNRPLTIVNVEYCYDTGTWITLPTNSVLQRNRIPVGGRPYHAKTTLYYSFSAVTTSLLVGQADGWHTFWGAIYAEIMIEEVTGTSRFRYDKGGVATGASKWISDGDQLTLEGAMDLWNIAWLSADVNPKTITVTLSR